MSRVRDITGNFAFRGTHGDALHVDRVGRVFGDVESVLIEDLRKRTEISLKVNRKLRETRPEEALIGPRER